jgi:hypothetical protein
MNLNLDKLSFLISALNDKIDLESKETVPVKPKKCQYEKCKTKLVLSNFACRCKNYYCSTHRYSDIHKCVFDYKATGKDILEKQMPSVIADKLERI